MAEGRGEKGAKLGDVGDEEFEAREGGRPAEGDKDLRWDVTVAGGRGANLGGNVRDEDDSGEETAAGRPDEEEAPARGEVTPNFWRNCLYLVLGEEAEGRTAADDEEDEEEEESSEEEEREISRHKNLSSLRSY